MKNQKKPYTSDYSRTRRRLLQALPLLALPAQLLAQPGKAVIPVTRLSNFTIRVSDVSRSQAFYQDLFGMPVQSRVDDQLNLRIGQGPQFMGIRPAVADEAPGITHIGYTLDDYDLRELQVTLEEQGYERISPPSPAAPGLDSAMKTWIRRNGNAEELYFADARGLIVQLSAAGYCGGAVQSGTFCPAPEAAPAGLMNLKDINHFTAFVNDGASANSYYQSIFGLSAQAYQGAGSPVFGVGDGYQFVMYAGPFPGAEGASANIHHACFSMENFDVERVLGLLTEYGLRERGDAPTGPMMHYISLRMPERGGAVGGTPELYFTDPDAILLQLQDSSYCGGGGKQGEICLSSEQA